MRHYIPLRGTLLDLLNPREATIPTQEDLDIATAEEKMFDVLFTHPRTTAGFGRQESLVASNVFLEENLKSGRIRPSKLPMASPVFFIKKKDGSLRLVQDY
ncbi:hypothetical protein LshimejAT787_0706070 [Lyophyllum shimeji]|uniref:Uncharacterized protein n=1 Tax=Lyophyllum shimeji TaxID=47721 RepID=A0A9P3PRK8_LYOSH|nr:hypothetical protein LshimejAT787_0706070 [Lyophyllum shimeji]